MIAWLAYYDNVFLSAMNPSLAGSVDFATSLARISFFISALWAVTDSLRFSHALGKNLRKSLTLSQNISQLNMMFFMSSSTAGFTQNVSNIVMLDASRKRSYASSSMEKNNLTDSTPSSYSTTAISPFIPN